MSGSKPFSSSTFPPSPSTSASEFSAILDRNAKYSTTELASFLDPTAVRKAKEDPYQTRMDFAYAMAATPPVSDPKYDEHHRSVLADTNALLPLRFFAAVHLFRNAYDNMRYPFPFLLSSLLSSLSLSFC